MRGIHKTMQGSLVLQKRRNGQIQNAGTVEQYVGLELMVLKYRGQYSLQLIQKESIEK